MGHKRHTAWPSTALILALGLIGEGQAADNLSFKGNLVQEACTLRPGDDAVTLELWDVTSKHLYINTRSQGKDFRLHLENCDTTVGSTVTITFGGRENAALPGMLALDAGSGASGIGVGIETPSNKPLPLNTVSDAQVLSDGSNVIALKAFVQGEPQAISDQTIGQGVYRVTSTFTLDYP
ncbi:MULTISPECIES: fimbrial protein [Pseudomonas]|jgi:type 1 fimbria pilin|uniref:Type 1 fimbrial protein n=1 Tax=Pseudomonas synxantha TaxID=47883 RepID=A0A5D3G1B9_9PSED|nr:MULTISPECIES: fimbrial protein [Pseudomonas]MBY8971749.1 type 1 fimbrial protein [Pseudomonas sp. P867]MCK3827415.1 type 1 fimbrial protein [Pseudomonas sp. W2Aug9]MCK3832667.1 type 1 fimbrial protein [Pseudomonas fluorescens]MCK3852615.1 type 1 fimbrial protein [Pseudomonas sp. W2Jun17]QUW64634.1 type 1 fimbrial protein [Pseudomonas synxantha]